MVFSLLNILGLFGLLSLIPLIILYLIKPKPDVLKVPSLMFFMQKTKSSRIQSLFRYFERELLFFLQLLVLLLLSLSLAQPIFTINKDAISNNIVFLLDTSASSNVIEVNGQTRLEISKNKIKELATNRNSLILIKSIPTLALKNVGKSELLRYLDKIKSTDDLSDISSSIIAASELITEGKGRIIVLSDMHTSKGISIETARNIIEGKGIHVDLINTASYNRKNIGIINLLITEDSANLYIKNYNKNLENVQLKIGNNQKILQIKPGNTEPYVFKYNEGVTEIKIENKDDFSNDNKVYLVKPYNETVKVLYISNSPSKYISAVLNSIPGLKITYSEPPIISKNDYDIYIINNIDYKNILAGTLNEIKEKMDKGKIIILTAQYDLNKLDTGSLIGKFDNLKDGGEIKTNFASTFTKDVEFGYVKKYYPIKEFKGQQIAVVENDTIIGIDENHGKLFYYGLIDTENDFKLNPSYPVFWNSIISYLLGRSTINELNLHTGNYFYIANESILLDKSGVFDFGKNKIAVNLLNEEESNINIITNVGEVNKIDSKLESIKTNVDYKLEFYLILIALLLIAFEFYYIKRRGEL